MNKIPAEIDNLMWAAAESGDPRAVDEFGQRYPAYRSELVKRVAMVRSLRTARPWVDAPPFRPSAHVQHRQPRRSWALVAAGGLAFATVAFASIATWQRTFPATHRTAMVEPIAVSKPDLPHAKAVQPHESTGEMHVVPKDVPNDVPTNPEPIVAIAPFERPVTVSHERVSLVGLMRELALQARVKLIVAPGFQDQMVEARYAGVPFLQAMQDLGQNFGFTPMVQGDNEILAIPALDPSKPPVTVPQGSYSEPLDGTENTQKKPGPVKSGNTDNYSGNGSY